MTAGAELEATKKAIAAKALDINWYIIPRKQIGKAQNAFPILVRVLYGAKRIRTAGPLNAIEMRYQLRYSPLLTI